MRSSRRRALGLALALGLGLAGSPANADGSPDADARNGAGRFDVFNDPALRELHQLDDIAPFEDLAPLRSFGDSQLQAELDEAVEKLALHDAVEKRQLAVVLVDITRLERPRVASVNGDHMMYAASLPKIAILLAAFEKIAEGRMPLDAKTEATLTAMIRNSSNKAATEMMRRVGKDYIARVLLSPRYRLYDPKRNGGLWVGKDYAKTGLWRRDPLHNLSHGATALQVARFYYLLETGNLVTPEHSLKMKEILAEPAIEHKFVKALKRVNPAALLFRKSGTWRTYHADSAIVERGRRAYIAVALADSRSGGAWLQQMAVAMDGIIYEQSWLDRILDVTY